MIYITCRIHSHRHTAYCKIYKWIFAMVTAAKCIPNELMYYRFLLFRVPLLRCFFSSTNSNFFSRRRKQKLLKYGCKTRSIELIWKQRNCISFRFGIFVFTNTQIIQMIIRMSIHRNISSLLTLPNKRNAIKTTINSGSSTNGLLIIWKWPT